MLQGARGLTQPAMQATAVVTAMGAKDAALSRLSAEIVPPKQYRMPAGSATAIPVQTASPVPSAECLETILLKLVTTSFIYADFKSSQMFN